MSAKSVKIDMIHGSLWDKILKFSLPLAATGILQQVFNAADMSVVGRFTGEMGKACMAAVGANAPVIGLLINLFIGVALGTNVVIANYIGQGREEKVTGAVGTSLVFALAAGIFTAIFGEIFAKPILTAQKVPDEVLDLAITYLRIYLAGLPVILLYNFEAAIFRGIGDTRTPLITLAISGVINVVLNIILVAGAGMTVEGVAIATVISNAVSTVILFIKMIRSDTCIHISASDLKIEAPVFKRMLAIGIPAGLQGAVFAFANIIIQSAINSLGTIVMAASSAAINIESFAFYVFSSFGQACTTFTGQNFGAGDAKRCRKTYRLCLLEGYLCLWFTIILILFFGKKIIYLFNTDPEVIRIAYERLKYIFLAYNFSILYEVTSGYLRGFGISLAPALLTVTGIVGTRLCWIALVFPLYETFGCIMLIYPISLATAAFLNLAAMIKIRPVKATGLANQ